MRKTVLKICNVQSLFFDYPYGKNPYKIQNLFFVPVPIFSLDSNNERDAFLRSPDFQGRLREPRSRAEEINDNVFAFFS